MWNEGSREEYGLSKGNGVQGTVLRMETLTCQRSTEQSMGLHEDESVSGGKIQCVEAEADPSFVRTVT